MRGYGKTRTVILNTIYNKYNTGNQNHSFPQLLTHVEGVSENAASHLKGSSKATFELNVKTVENVIICEKASSFFLLLVGFTTSLWYYICYFEVSQNKKKRFVCVYKQSVVFWDMPSLLF